MKLLNHPLFIYCSLFLFFPVGVVILYRSSLGAKHRIIGTICGFLIFAGILSLVIFTKKEPTNPEDFYIVATRTQLSIGQSGGLAITNGTDYYADYNVSCDNENILDVSQNLYTAKAKGECTLTITFANQTRQVTVTVNDDSNTSAIVYITPKGSRYHRNQAHAGKTAVSVSEEDAIMSSKTPCAVCYP